MTSLLLAIHLCGDAHAGLFGNDAPGRIPIPARLFDADVEDVDGVVVRLKRVTFDGEVFLYGLLGRGQVTVPFDQIAEATFQPAEDDDHRLAIIRLTTGEEVRLRLDSELPIYGLGHFGNYRLNVADARRLVLRPGG